MSSEIYSLCGFPWAAEGPAAAGRMSTQLLPTYIIPLHAAAVASNHVNYSHSCQVRPLMRFRLKLRRIRASRAARSSPAGSVRGAGRHSRKWGFLCEPPRDDRGPRDGGYSAG